MTATVTEHLQVSLPLDVCVELGITPGVQLNFRAREGKLEAVKVLSDERVLNSNLAQIYTAERDAEELTIQQGCSCDVPEDFPR